MRALLTTLLAAGLALAGCDDGASTGAPTDGLPPDGGPGSDARLDAVPDLEPDLEPDAAPPAPAFCAGPTAQRYAPFESTELELFPDDLLTRPDPESPTGLRLDLGAARWPASAPRVIERTLADMGALSGFGHNGAVVMRFSAPLGEGWADIEGSLADPALMLFDLDADPPARVPYSVRLSARGAALIVQPERPLRAGARHGLLLTTDAVDAEGGCIAPSPALQALLTGGGDPRLAALAPAYAALLAAADRTPTEVSAATVFTTHADTEVLRRIAAELPAYPAEWAAEPVCTQGTVRRACHGLATLWDHRDDRAVLTAAPVARWQVPVSFDLPLPGTPPAPALMFGHGLGSDRSEDLNLASRWGEVVAVISVDALGHGGHPTADRGDDFATTIMSFLGLSLGGLSIDGRTLTGNFDQSALDRLQVLDLVRRAPDIDGDGLDDIDPDRVGYYGVSLGGMMGPQLVALDPRIDLAVLQVPGGHLSRFATSSGPVEQFMPLVINLFGSEDRFDRLLPVLQAAVDRADPATWAPLVMNRPGGPPHLLMQVSTFDEIVPPATGIALARALDLPHVGEVIEPVALLETAPTPTQLDLPGGMASGGFCQFDRVGDDAAPRRSGHENLPWSSQAQAQVSAFLRPWIAGEPPVLIDAYGELGTAPLD